MIKPQAIRQIEHDKFNNEYSSFPDLESLKFACKKLGITNSMIYREKYKQFCLPAHPERIFREWVSYKDFFDISDFISYGELKKLISSKNLKNAKSLLKSKQVFISKTP